ncbi:MAG: pentapeptide repeat-containing protein [Streptosporangiaceae bacterium]|jgi:uncharacterized protein YjbI with pentapeptide repeats
MDSHDLAALPFAAALTPHQGELNPDTDYDCVHFADATFDDPKAGSSRFAECAFTAVSFQGGQMQRARFLDVWLRDVRLITTSLARTRWADATVGESIAAGVEAFGAQLHRVVFRGCKLDSVNFRGAALTDVCFDHCELRDVDFADAALTRTSFPGSRLRRTDFSRVHLDHVDLRDAELGITIGPDSLRGATVSMGQLVDLAPLLAQTLGITVSDD